MNVQVGQLTVFFVRRAEIARGTAEFEVPVVLIDAALQHLHPEALELTVVDAPGEGALGACCIDSRQLALYPAARRAVIIEDRRGVAKREVVAA